LLAIHGQKEPNPNILFGFAKSKEWFGKVQWWGSCSHIEQGFILTYYVDFQVGFESIYN